MVSNTAVGFVPVRQHLKALVCRLRPMLIIYSCIIIVHGCDAFVAVQSKTLLNPCTACQRPLKLRPSKLYMGRSNFWEENRINDDSAIIKSADDREHKSNGKLLKILNLIGFGLTINSRTRNIGAIICSTIIANILCRKVLPSHHGDERISLKTRKQQRKQSILEEDERLLENLLSDREAAKEVCLRKAAKEKLRKEWVSTKLKASLLEKEEMDRIIKINTEKKKNDDEHARIKGMIGEQEKMNMSSDDISSNVAQHGNNIRRDQAHTLETSSPNDDHNRNQNQSRLPLPWMQDVGNDIDEASEFGAPGIRQHNERIKRNDEDMSYRLRIKSEEKTIIANLKSRLKARHQAEVKLKARLRAEEEACIALQEAARLKEQVKFKARLQAEEVACAASEENARLKEEIKVNKIFQAETEKETRVALEGVARWKEEVNLNAILKAEEEVSIALEENARWKEEVKLKARLKAEVEARIASEEDTRWKAAEEVKLKARFKAEVAARVASEKNSRWNESKIKADKEIQTATMKVDKARMQQEEEARITRKSAQISRPKEEEESPYIAAIEEAARLNEEARLKKEKEAAYVTATETTRLKDLWSYTNLPTSKAHNDAYSNAYREHHISINNNTEEVNLEKEKEAHIAAMEMTRLKNVWRHANSQKSHSRDDAYSIAYREAFIAAENAAEEAKLKKKKEASIAAQEGTRLKNIWSRIHSQKSQEAKLKKEKEVSIAAQEGTRLKNIWSHLNSQKSHSRDDAYNSAYARATNLSPTSTSAGSGANPWHSYTHEFRGQETKIKDYEVGHMTNESAYAPTTAPVSRLQKRQTKFINQVIELDHSAISGTTDRSSTKKGTRGYISNYETPFANRIGGSTERTGWVAKESINKDVPQRKHVDSSPIKRGTKGYISNYQVPFDQRIGGNPDKTDSWSAKELENKTELKAKKMNYSSSDKKSTISYISNYETDYADRIGGNPHKTERRVREVTNERQIPQNLLPSSHEEL